jgi:hypothetical protein
MTVMKARKEAKNPRQVNIVVVENRWLAIKLQGVDSTWPDFKVV